MEYDIYNERKQINKIANDQLNNLLKNLEIKKGFYINNFPNGNINNIPSGKESTSRTVFSKANTIDSLNHNKSMNFKNNMNNSNIYENINKSTRKDNYGNDIKKGGKHKIAFADELKITASLMKKNENISKNRKSLKLSSSKHLEESLFPKLPMLIIKRRSRTPINSRSSMIKNIINIFKNNKKCKRNIEEFLINVIKFESTKKENKINAYSIKKANNLDEEVCCSCYCFVM